MNDRAGNKTRERLLDVAEKLFAENGFDGVSVRDITQAADVRLASINYHFGSKDRLVFEVIARRANVLGGMRRKALADVDFSTEAPQQTLDSVLKAFIQPMLHMRLTGGPGWTHYCRLIAQQAMLRKSRPMASEHFDETALAFVHALQKSVPGLSDRQAHFAFQYLIGSMLYVFTENGRLDALSQGAFTSSAISDMCNDLIPFVRGGVLELAKGQT